MKCRRLPRAHGREYRLWKRSQKGGLGQVSMYVIGPIKIPKKFGLSSSIIALSAKPSSREAMENVFGFHGQEGCSKVPPPPKKKNPPWISQLASRDGPDGFLLWSTEPVTITGDSWIKVDFHKLLLLLGRKWCFPDFSKPHAKFTISPHLCTSFCIFLLNIFFLRIINL